MSDAAALVAMVAVQVICMAAMAVINFCWGRDVGRQDVIKGGVPATITSEGYPAGPDDWPRNARTIMKWARGDTVNVDNLIGELEAWLNYWRAREAAGGPRSEVP